MADQRDIPAEAGARAPFKHTETPVGDAGSGPGHSGQEYDAAGQKDWRERAHRRDVPHRGAAPDSGLAPIDDD